MTFIHRSQTILRRLCPGARHRRMALVQIAFLLRRQRLAARGACSADMRRAYLAAKAAYAVNDAHYRVARLTRKEQLDTIAPARACLARLREGVATEDQHAVLYTCVQMAMGIEARGIVRGLREHLASALQALETIRARALASGAWRPTALYFYELDALREAVDLHAIQLRHVSAGELASIATHLIARTQSAGAAVARASMKDLGLQAA